MLSKDKRLNLKKDFKWVAAGPLRSEASKRVETKYLKLFLRLGENQLPRVGIAVSAHSFTKATERNKARRLTSAAFEAIYPSLPATINIVALPKAGISKVKSGLVLLDLEEGLKRARIV